MRVAEPKLGGRLVANETLQPGQTSYQTEAAKVAAAKPQVIFTETDPQTASTFFGELHQMGKLVTTIGTEPTIIPTWYKAVSGPWARRIWRHTTKASSSTRRPLGLRGQHGVQL